MQLQMKRDDLLDRKTETTIYTARTDLVDWWAGTVFLTLFPIMISIIINFCLNSTVDFIRMFGSGDLILVAFLITTPSVISYFKENSSQRGKEFKIRFYLLLFVAFAQLVAYTSFTIKEENQPLVVYCVSGVCIISSILTAWMAEKALLGEDSK